jgi:hypothetical protein
VGHNWRLAVPGVLDPGRTHSRNLLGASGTAKGRLTAAASRESTIARALVSKGREGRRGSRGVVEGKGSARALFIGARNGELGRRWWW